MASCGQGSVALGIALKDDLRAALRGYDGRALTILSEALARFRDHDGLLDALVELASDENRLLSVASTWMLKAELDDGRRLTSGQADRLLAGIAGVSAWQAQLHLCQSLARIDVPAPRRDPLRAWLMPLLEAERPFLRAWALDALCRLPGEAKARDRLLDRMGKDPAASVRARVRNLRKATARLGTCAPDRPSGGQAGAGRG